MVTDDEAFPERESKGTLKPTEYHPAADSAKRYISTLGFERISLLRESFASTSMSGNRLSDVCLETLERLLSSKPVSDRYLLGLAWTIKYMEEI